jgi:lysyl-tRNA synthetase class 2
MQPEADRLRGRIRNLERRAAILRQIRSFFDSRGFVEIEAPILVPSPGLEVHLDAFGLADERKNRWLITSPEYQMKRLLAGGMARIYSLGKVFRRGERGPHHNPEFTMLEWYRGNAGWTEIADDFEALTAELGVIDEWERMSVADATARWAGVRIDGDEDLPSLRKKIAAAGHPVPESGRWDDVFFQLFLDAVEPRLAEKPIILYDWPRPLKALAREKPGDPRVVERFEAYAHGLELCNAFGELTDPDEQRRRFDEDLAERRARGLPAYPIDERFLNAVGQMPPSAGIAVGVDRLVMLITGAREIQEVLPFADEEL